MGLFRGLWYAVFHAVSSFCNAGFDLMGAAGTPFVSLTGYAGDPLVNFTVMGLIVLGGIGFLTWGDVREHKWHLRAYCLQSKLVLAVTAALILLPALFFLLYELRLPQWQTLTLGEKVQGALFQAVTPRTAGYNTLDLSQLSEPSRLLITLLMLVGGSPGSTAGGFKVTTLAVFVLGGPGGVPPAGGSPVLRPPPPHGDTAQRRGGPYDVSGAVSAGRYGHLLRGGHLPGGGAV